MLTLSITVLPSKRKQSALADSSVLLGVVVAVTALSSFVDLAPESGCNKSASYKNDNHSQHLVMVRGFSHPLGAVLVSLSLSALPLPARAATPQVVAVDGTLCDITRRLAGSAADVTCLIPPGGDPHAYRLKPSDRQKLAKASLVVHVGFGLTPVVSKISSSVPVVAVGELALPGGAGGDPHVGTTLPTVPQWLVCSPRS